MAANTRNCDITIDEIVAIVKHYVKLHNRLYQESWKEEEYLAAFMDAFANKRLGRSQKRPDL
jgi:lactam utilization protein B